MDKTPKRLIWLAVFTFAVSPLLSWASVLATDETAVFASLSRMIWYSGSALQIFIAMLVLFIPIKSCPCRDAQRSVRSLQP